MQFREQGRRVQCIRSTYDSASKRCRQKVVAAFDRYADKLPSAELVELTDAERQELAAWFEARSKQSAERRISVAAAIFQQFAESIKVAGAAMTDSEADSVWSALADVAKALTRAGHPKPKPKKHKGG